MQRRGALLLAHDLMIISRDDVGEAGSRQHRFKLLPAQAVLEIEAAGDRGMGVGVDLVDGGAALVTQPVAEAVDQRLPARAIDPVAVDNQ